MSVTIPCKPDLTHYDMEVVLSGATFVIEFKLNTRDNTMFMELMDQAGGPILSSMRVVVDWPLGFRTTDPRRPRGVFIATDTTGRQIDPGAGDLGGRVQLEYFDASEIA